MFIEWRATGEATLCPTACGSYWEGSVRIAEQAVPPSFSEVVQRTPNTTRRFFLHLGICQLQCCWSLSFLLLHGQGARDLFASFPRGHSLKDYCELAIEILR